MSDVIDHPHADVDLADMSEVQWREAFVSIMMATQPQETQDDPDFLDFCRQSADSYYPDRETYDTVKEAVESDMSYWGE